MYCEISKSTKFCLYTIVGVVIFTLVYLGVFYTKYSVSYEDCPIVSKSDSSVAVSYNGESYVVPVESVIPDNADSILCTILKSRSTSDVVKVIQHEERSKNSRTSAIALLCCSIAMMAASIRRRY